MSTETVFGLSGKEIISDLLYQIKAPRPRLQPSWDGLL